MYELYKCPEQVLRQVFEKNFINVSLSLEYGLDFIQIGQKFDVSDPYENDRARLQHVFGQHLVLRDVRFLGHLPSLGCYCRGIGNLLPVRPVDREWFAVQLQGGEFRK